MTLNRESPLPITQMMSRPTYVIPASPPPDLLAELDAAAAVLDELSVRAVELRLEMDAQTRALRIELSEHGDVRRLGPTQLLDLLSAA